MRTKSDALAIDTPVTGYRKILKFTLDKVDFRLRHRKDLRLWDEYKTRLKPFDEEGPVLIMGFEETTSTSLLYMLRCAGVTPCVVCGSLSQTHDLSQIKGDFSHLIINLDAFSDIDVAIDLLLSFRKQRPDVIVLIASTDVIKDDLGSERISICDVTLRMPISSQRLLGGLEAAKVNHVDYIPDVMV